MLTTLRLSCVLLVIGIVGTADFAFAQYPKREPSMGSLKPGERVLVDDGTCPKGKIKEVIGGNHVKVGGKAHVKRTKRCIPRP